MARSLRDEDFVAAPPPPGVWAAIAAEVEGTGAPAAADTDAPPPARPATAEPGPTSLVERRRARLAGPGRWLAVAAAAAVVLVVGVAALVASVGDDGTDTLASAVLEPLTGAAATGEAQLVAQDGSTQLDVTLDGELPPADGYYEVWLIDSDVQGMVSLGPVREDGTYDVPADIDVGQFPIVDVSVEPGDGNPVHSGNSILRGTLA